MDLRACIHLLTSSEEQATEKATISKKVVEVMMALALLAVLIIYVYFKKSITNESIFDILFDKGNLFEIFVVFFSALFLTICMLLLLQKAKNNLYGESIPVRPEHEQGDKSKDYKELAFIAVILILAVLLSYGIMLIMSIYQYFQYIFVGGFFIIILVIILDQRKKETCHRRVIKTTRTCRNYLSRSRAAKERR